MEQGQMLSVGFYVWWLCVNSCLFLAEFCFIQNFTKVRAKKFMVPYVLLSDLLTLWVMYDQSGGVLRLLLHTGIIVCFTRFVLKLKWVAAVAPTLIILTLFTFMEGFQTVLMRWLSEQTMEKRMGIVLQMLISGMLVLMLAAILRYVSKKYGDTGQQRISSYLYTLLLPCIFIVWVIRSGLGLDMWMNFEAMGNRFFEEQSVLWAVAWLLGTCVIFFIILKLVHKIIVLSIQEREQKSLEDQVKKQRIYLAEAEKRNEHYRRFQHDIDNHFLVLTGLFREKKYDEAREYFEHLHDVSDRLLIGIKTGNPAADILLNEKIGFAKSNGIQVKYDVNLPSDCVVENMDLCIILANALDNAIQACMKENRQPEISLIVRKRYHFLVIEIENTNLKHGKPEYGTGLKNIEHTVEKYEGTMEIESGGGTFRLTVLLCMKPFAKGE